MKARPHVRTIADLPLDELRVAGDAIETVIEHRACMPADEMLVMLAGKFRDDVRDALGMSPLDRPISGPDRKQPDDLTDEESDTLTRAVARLVVQFRAFIDDPELVDQLSGLNARLMTCQYGRMVAREAGERAKAS